MWVCKQFVTRVHALFYFLPEVNDDENDGSHGDASTWKVIFNPLDIYFIRGDIHSRSFKNINKFMAANWLGTHEWVFLKWN